MNLVNIVKFDAELQVIEFRHDNVLLATIYTKLADINFTFTAISRSSRQL
ncbi:MAG: hypothetical protein Nk1A_8900 [Endomicrobiia bacterium]|nr:MAG: hypothetical protein Nk1A_8900 [Endomicrobiia bacterium]